MKTLSRIFLAMLLLVGVASCQKPTPDGPDGPGQTVNPESGEPVVLEDFTVTLTALHAGDVFLSIEPKNPEMTYWYSLQIEENMPETDEEIIATDRSYFEYIAQSNNMSLEKLLGDNLVKGEKTWMYNGLSPKTDYVFYLYGITADGTVQSSVNKIEFRTPSVKQLDCTFDILVGEEITANSFSITIVPSDDTVAYFYDIFPAWMYEEYCLSDEANIPAFVAEYIPALASENGYDVATTVGLISCYGPLTDDFTLEDGIEPASTYYVYAVGIGADGTTTTEPQVVAVNTQRPPMNTFEVTMSTVEDDRATFYVAPAHNESYVALFELQEYMYDAQGNPLSDEEIIDVIIAAQGTSISKHIYSGTSSVFECPLIPNKDYYCLVFGYFGGEVTTPLTKVEFKTKEADAFDAEILVTIAEVTKTEASIWFQPYKEPMPHIFNYMTYAQYREWGRNDEAIKRHVNELIDSMWNPAKMSREEWLSRALETGSNSWRIDGLEPNTQYVVYAIGMVPDGSFTTKAFVQEFKTKEQKEGPQVEEILFTKEGGDVKTIGAWFYFDTDSNVSKFAMSHIADDATVYEMSDDALLAYLEESHDTTYVNEVTNQTYFTVYHKDVPVGSTIYYAGAVYSPDGSYTIIRTTYEVQ